jgi:hypothetical protein
MWTRSFWKATAERVVSAFVLSLLGVLGTVQAADLHSVRWGEILTAAGFTAGLVLLKCLAAGTGVIGPRGSPSLVRDPAAAGPTSSATLTGSSLPPTTRTNGGTGHNVRKIDPARADLQQAFGAEKDERIAEPKQGGYRGGDVTPPD